MNYETAREILAEAMKYAQDAIPLRPELYMLTYSSRDKSNDGPRKFIGKMRKNPKAIYEGAYKGAMEDWLTSLPKPAIDELKAKHGKDLAHTGGAGYKDIATKKTLPLHKSIVGILRKHKVKPFANNIHDSSHAIQMSFHTYHGDMNEAVSTNDPNRGRTGRKKPIVPQGMMPDDSKDPRTGNPVRTRGKLHSRMDTLSPETRERYRRNYGYRTRVAGRKGRIYPMSEAAPDIGQNLKGMPKKSGRKLAYALKSWGKGQIGNPEYRVADARHARRMSSNVRRFGKKLDTALKDFSARTGIKLK